MVHLKLGEILVKQGLLTEKQLHHAIEVQKTSRERIGLTLIKLGYITEEQMAQALGTQLALPYYSSENTELLKPQKDQSLEKLIPIEFAMKYNVLPLSRHLNSLTCAVDDPLDLLLIDNLKRVTGYEINLVVGTPTALKTAVTSFYLKEGRIDSTKSSLLDEAVENTYIQKYDEQFITPSKELTSSAELSLDKLIAKAGEAPVIKLVDLIIRQAIDERASDIHIEAFENKIKLRYRIDGKLYDIPPPAPHLHLAIVSRIKILARLDIAEKRLPQDGSITAKLEDRNVDIRISTIPTIWGEKAVMRILDKSAVPLELGSLGFEQKQVDVIRQAIHSPYGLVFVTGPTGSGKSTTLYAALSESIDPTKNTLTVEDPVEYKIEGINQVAVKPDIGLTFAAALRAFLRQDPDVIMVGEVRDVETASICVRAALTGHLVLSTLHTNDSISAINRLIDLGVPHYLLPPSLILIVAQRLARRLCPKCKEPYEPRPEQHGGIKFEADLIYRSKGCDQCNGTGYKGRTVIAEVLTIEETIRELIAKNASYDQIREGAKKNGMVTLFESGIKLVEKGITSFSEIGQVTVDYS